MSQCWAPCSLRTMPANAHVLPLPVDPFSSHCSQSAPESTSFYEELQVGSHQQPPQAPGPATWASTQTASLGDDMSTQLFITLECLKSWQLCTNSLGKINGVLPTYTTTLIILLLSTHTSTDASIAIVFFKKGERRMQVNLFLQDI